MSHAPFAPSSAKRWLNCPGSFGLGLQLPDKEDSDYARDGTRLHKIAADILYYEFEVRREVEEATAYQLKTADERFLKPYIDYALTVKQEACWVRLEERIDHSPLLFGTPDLIAVYPLDRDLMEVVDLKTGHGIMVDPEGNDQLLAYAYMALTGLKERKWGQWLHEKERQRQKRKKPGEFDLSDIAVVPEPDPVQFLPQTIRLTIVQPACEEEPVKSWDTTAWEVMAWGLKAEKAITAAIYGATELQPGDWCRFCKAKPVCPKLRGLVLESMPVVVQELMPDKVAFWLDKAELLEQWLNGLREFAHETVKAGIEVPGWGLKPKRATRSWDNEQEVRDIARRKRLKIFQERPLMSPAMAEKAHNPLPEELREHIVVVSSGTNLVRASRAPKPVTVASDAEPMAKLMANFELLKFRS